MKFQVILVTGATGAVGPRVVSALMEAGYGVRALALDAAPAEVWPTGVDLHLGDVTDMATVRRTMQGVDSVVHLAAILHILNPPPELREKYERINVGGTTTVVDEAVKAGVKRIVLASTIAVYGPSNGQILNEDSLPQPDTIYAQTKLAAEKIVLNARNTDGQPFGTVLRFGAVYGPRIKGNYERLVRALARNRFVPIGNGNNRRTLVYDKDVGRAAALAVSHPAAAGRIFNVTDGRFHTLSEIIASICSALSQKPPRLSLPVGPMRALIRLIEMASGAIGLKPPVTQAMIDKYNEDIAVDGSLIQKELGFVPQYDLKTGWEEMIREMRR
jgi:nucleoside-diphosphate-sugar epimerase